MPSIRSVLAPLALGLALVASGCAGKSGGGTKAPRKSKADVEAEQQAVAQAAKANKLIILANEDLGNGRYVSARKRAEDALAQNPNNADAYVVLGASHWRAGDFSASTEALRKAVELEPKNYGAGVALARNLRAAGDYAGSLAVLEPVIAAENEGFDNRECAELSDCEEVGGWCDATSKTCRAPVGLDTRVGQLWAHYMLLDAEKGPPIADEVFLSGAAGADIVSDAIRGYADYLRAFQGKGELATIEGKTASAELALDYATGLMHAPVKVGDKSTRAMLSLLNIESRIDADLAKSLGLESLGKVTLFNLGEFDLTLVPQVEFEGLVIKNVPALMADLSDFGYGLPEKPGMILGHQVLDRLGSITADFPQQQLTLSAEAPASAPGGASELPLIALDQWNIHVPATRVSIDGAEHQFWVWLGGVHPSAVSTTAKAYLKSGHLPRDIENPEDPDNGRKMVFVDKLSFGEATLSGLGGLVYLDEPGEPGIAGVRAFAGFELGGYISVPAMGQLRMTFVPSSAKLWIEQPAG